MGVLQLTLFFKYFLVFSSSLLFALLSVTFSFQEGIQESNLQTKTDSVMMENQSFLILFETNKYTTDTFPEQQTEELKALLEEFPELSVRLEARTDNVGSPLYNLALAEKRMTFVRNELLQRGIEEDRFMEFVFGEEEPLADNQSPKGRQANRSVRVVAGLYAPIRMINGRFVSDEDGKGIEGVLYTGTKHNKDSFQIDSTGEFSFPVADQDIFFLEFFSRDHIMGRTYFNLSRVNPSLGTIPLTVLQQGDSFSFQDIQFDPYSANVSPEFRQSLLRLLHMIRLAEGYRFEIQGHVNLPIRRRTKDIGLADERAEKVYNYLIENGIDSNRLEWRGYGNWLILFPNPKNDSQHSLNRRVSVKVLGRIDD